LEERLLHLLQEHGYIVLFFWSILEGELGLIMAGILSHTGHMHAGLSIFVAGLGGFAGDQIYFYIGRYAKGYIHKKMRKHRRKFAIAHLLLKKYGWPIIFLQRYMYGLRTVIPMSIGLTRYSAGKFALINLLSAWVWAAVTILLAYMFGEQLIALLHYAKAHWYFALPFALAVLGGFYMLNKKIEKNLEERGKTL
jgi:membrane protein DedA with SNARE-associated domain